MGWDLPPTARESRTCIHNSTSEVGIAARGIAHAQELGAHRDGYSEQKCRSVLVRYCSKIPRNYDYANGVHLVYEQLREHLGDENMDLSMGVLYELIEVDASHSFEGGAPFRRWRHDHLLRATDLENSHVPRLGNIIVGSVIPTMLLHRLWAGQAHRRPDEDPESPSEITDGQGLRCHHVNLRTRQEWQIAHTTFISGPRHGTSMSHCPSAQQVRRYYDSCSNIPTGRLVYEREYAFTEAEPGRRAARSMIHRTSKNIANTKSKSLGFQIDIHFVLGAQTCLKRLFDRGCMPYMHTKGDAKHHGGNSMRETRRPVSPSVSKYEGLTEVQNLPCPESHEGRQYYANIINRPFPKGASPQNGIFLRKHVRTSTSLSSSEIEKSPRMRSAEELAVEIASQEFSTWTSSIDEHGVQGPFTADLFHDGGLDYCWK